MHQIIKEAKELYEQLIKDKPDIRQHASILAKVHKKKFKLQNPLTEEQKQKNKDNLLYINQKKDPDENQKLSADGGISNFNQHSTTSLAEGQLGQLLQQESFMAEITKGKDIYQFLQEQNIDLIEEEDEEEEEDGNNVNSFQKNRNQSQNLSMGGGANLKNIDKIGRIIKRKSTIFDQDKIKNKAFDHINQQNFLEAENDLQIFLNQSIKKRMPEQIQEGVKNYYEMIKNMQKPDSNISTITIFYYLQNFLIYMDQNQLPEPKSIKNFKFERFYGKHGKNNTAVLEIFIRKHNQEIIDFFEKFSNGKNFINSNDLIIAFQQILDIQDLTLYEFKEDDTHFFNKYNSYKLVKEHADVFLQQQKFNNKFFPSGFNKEEGCKLGLFEILNFIVDFIDSLDDCYLEWEDYEDEQGETTVQKPKTPQQQPKNLIEVKTESQFLEEKQQQVENIQQVQQMDEKELSIEQQLQNDINKYKNLFNSLEPGNQQIEIIKVVRQMEDSLKIIQNKILKPLKTQQTAPFLNDLSSYSSPVMKNSIVQNIIDDQPKNQLRENLKEIFTFYANQQDKNSVKTVSMHNLQELSLSWKQFVQFVRQFSIEDFNKNVNIVKIQPIFKRRSNMTFKPINFRQFEQVCKDISCQMFLFQEQQNLNKSYKSPQHSVMQQKPFISSHRPSSPSINNNNISMDNNKKALQNIISSQQNLSRSSYQLPGYTQSLDTNAFRSVLDNKSSLPNIFQSNNNKSSLKQSSKHKLNSQNSIILDSQQELEQIANNQQKSQQELQNSKKQHSQSQFVSFQTPDNFDNDEKEKAFKNFQHYIHLDDKEHYRKLLKNKGYFFFITEEQNKPREDGNYSKKYDKSHPELEEKVKNKIFIKKNVENISQIKSPKGQSQLSFLSNKSKLLNLSKIKLNGQQNTNNTTIPSFQADNISHIQNQTDISSMTPFLTSSQFGKSNINFNQKNNNYKKITANFSCQFDGVTPKNSQQQENVESKIDTNIQKDNNNKNEETKFIKIKVNTGSKKTIQTHRKVKNQQNNNNINIINDNNNNTNSNKDNIENNDKNKNKSNLQDNKNLNIKNQKN